jgi:hypothetical protein
LNEARFRLLTPTETGVRHHHLVLSAFFCRSSNSFALSRPPVHPSVDIRPSRALRRLPALSSEFTGLDHIDTHTTARTFLIPLRGHSRRRRSRRIVRVTCNVAIGQLCFVLKSFNVFSTEMGPFHRFLDNVFVLCFRNRSKSINMSVSPTTTNEHLAQLCTLCKKGYLSSSSMQTAHSINQLIILILVKSSSPA